MFMFLLREEHRTMKHPVSATLCSLLKFQPTKERSLWCVVQVSNTDTVIVFPNRNPSVNDQLVEIELSRYKVKD